MRLTAALPPTIIAVSEVPAVQPIPVPPGTVSATLIFDRGGISMDVTVQLGDKPLKATLLEWSGPNGTGIAVVPVGPTKFSSLNTDIATVNADTGVLTYLKTGTAVIVGSNAGNGMSASGTVTIVPNPPVAASATIAFVPQ